MRNLVLFISLALLAAAAPSLFGDAFGDHHVGPLATSPSGLLYAGVWIDNVYEIQDGGTWEPLGAIPRRTVFLSLVVDPEDPCRIYVGTGAWSLLVFTKSGTAECN